MRATDNTKGPLIKELEALRQRVAELEKSENERKRAEARLRESEERYRSLVNNVRLGIFRSTPGPTGRFLAVNPAMAEITGYSSEALLQMNVADLYLHPEEREAILQEAASTTRKITREVYLRKKDGAEIVVSDTKAVVSDSAGKILYFDGILEDITERKRAKEALQESKKKYRDLADALPQTVFEIDEAGNLTFVNLNSIDIFAHALQSSDRGWNALQMFVSADRDSVKKNIQRVLSGEELGGAGYTALRKDGSTFPVVLYASPIIKENRATGLRGIIVDITEHERAEEALRESEEKLRLMFESVIEGITVTDLDMRIVEVNQAVVSMHGYDNKGELIGRNAFELIADRDQARAMESIKRTLEDGYSGTIEYTCLRKNHSAFPAQLSVTVLRDASGKSIGFIAVTEDITERKRMQEQLIITDRLASIGELASGIAHELNNPLTSVIGFSQLLLNRDVPDDINRDVEIIHSEAQRAAEVVKNLLTFARKQAPVRRSVNINSIIEKVLELRTYVQRVNNIKVITHLALDLPEIMADYFQLQQVFLNIIVNAEHFMIEVHGRGTLTITTGQSEEIIKVSLADDGPGISKENLGHLFDPFFTTKEVGKGTGLGLSICHKIITEHGGRIYAESELGKGATFVLELPIRTADRERY